MRSQTTAVLTVGLLVLGTHAGAWAGSIVRLTPAQAVSRALKRNLGYLIDKSAPELSTAAERTARAAFDPVLFAEAEVSGSPGQISASRAGLPPVSSVSGGGAIGVRKSFVTGTSFEGRLTTSGLFGDDRGGLNPAYQSTFRFTARQSLLRGLDPSANQQAISSARLLRRASGQTLDRQAEMVAAETLRAYWDLHAALASVRVQEVALSNSQRSLAETLELIRAGRQPAAEDAPARYQVATQQRTLSVSLQAVENARDRLARIVGLVGPRSLETPGIVTAAQPVTEAPRMETAVLLHDALARRGDYRALHTTLTVRRAEARAARHNLLPKLDFVAGLFLTGISGDLPADATSTNTFDRGYFPSYIPRSFGWSAGLSLEIPLGNRDAYAKAELAYIEAKRAQLVVIRAEQAISQEINLAERAVRAAGDQLRLTKRALEVARLKVRNETERFRAGKSSAQILTLVQAELLREELAQQQAVADLNKALVELYAAAGLLVQQVGGRIP